MGTDYNYKMKKIVKVSVGICAYNEEQNIASVIKDVLAQKSDSWMLSEILVYSDGSEDNTAEIVKKIAYKKIKLIEGKSRKGKTFRLNQMFRAFKGDILIMFDADIKLVGKKVMTKIVNEFRRDNSVMLIGGNSFPITPKTFFQKAVFTTFQVFYDSRFWFRNGHNVFGCTGSCLSLRKELANKLSLPNIVNEDVYIYLACINEGYKFRYVDDAKVKYKLPLNLIDYIRQVLRSEPRAVHYDLSTHFSNIIHQELDRPFLSYFKSILKVFFMNPVGVLLMILINLLCIPFFSIVHKKYSLSWFTAESTKSI